MYLLEDALIMYAISCQLTSNTLVLFLMSTAPTGAPEGLMGAEITKSSIRLQWNPIDGEKVNGEIE